MDTYDNIGKKTNNRKNSGFTYKITHIADARCPKLTNLALKAT